MNLDKIDDLLDIRTGINVSEEPEQALLVIEGTSISTAIVKYTDNPKLQKEIDRYSKEREESINALIDARNSIVDVLNTGTLLNSINTAADWKDVDAFSKLINTLGSITKNIDELSNPQKVEIYVDPQEETPQSKDQPIGNVTNIQNNFIGNPATMIEALKSIEKF
jgi:hypothetical protein